MIKNILLKEDENNKPIDQEDISIPTQNVNQKPPEIDINMLLPQSDTSDQIDYSTPVKTYENEKDIFKIRESIFAKEKVENDNPKQNNKNKRKKK